MSLKQLVTILGLLQVGGAIEMRITEFLQISLLPEQLLDGLKCRLHRACFTREVLMAKGTPSGLMKMVNVKLFIMMMEIW